GTVDPYSLKTYPERDRTLSHLSGRRRLIETMGRDSVYRFVTGSAAELLDIATVRNRMPPGLFLPRRHNVTQTRGYFPRHARRGPGRVERNGLRHALLRFC